MPSISSKLLLVALAGRADDGDARSRRRAARRPPATRAGRTGWAGSRRGSGRASMRSLLASCGHAAAPIERRAGPADHRRQSCAGSQPARAPDDRRAPFAGSSSGQPCAQPCRARCVAGSRNAAWRDRSASRSVYSCRWKPAADVRSSRDVARPVERVGVTQSSPAGPGAWMLRSCSPRRSVQVLHHWSLKATSTLPSGTACAAVGETQAQVARQPRARLRAAASTA